MRVKMRTYYAGPAGSAQPGSIIEVSESDGAALIAGRYAEPVETTAAPAPEVATAEPAPETATAGPAETAAAPRGRRRGR